MIKKILSGGGSLLLTLDSKLQKKGEKRGLISLLQEEVGYSLEVTPDE